MKETRKRDGIKQMQETTKLEMKEKNKDDGRKRTRTGRRDRKVTRK
jgi:hypothetical protein